jgi:hypothetical protein
LRVTEKRPTNSELALMRLEEQEAERQAETGILELFEPDEDAPLARDDEE